MKGKGDGWTSSHLHDLHSVVLLLLGAEVVADVEAGAVIGVEAMPVTVVLALDGRLFLTDPVVQPVMA